MRGRCSRVLFLVSAVFAQVPASAVHSRCVRVVADAAIVPKGPSRTTRLFDDVDRIILLRLAGYPSSRTLPLIVAGGSEHDIVARALAAVAAATNLDGSIRAMLWEELAIFAEGAAGHPISEAFLGTVDGEAAFVYQGTKRFNGKAYVLVITSSGAAYAGAVAPIERRSDWTTDLDALKPLR